jgi:succinyl-diaminopimelate desuccinylase
MHQADPVPLAQALINRPSVTPADGGAQAVLAGALSRIGFSVTRLRFGEIENLFARHGDASPHLCFAGHTDVVPPGPGWGYPPFEATLADGKIFGRGACDMKGAIAAFVAAAETRLSRGPLNGSISLLITGDEEGLAVDGTVKVLDWMRAHGQIPDFCVVGEPTNPARLGEVVKIGRRGSLNATLTVHGTQGHVAYPHLADNPVHRLLRILGDMIATPLDTGTAFFEASSLQVTSVDVGNPAGNVIPAAASARLNVRFNDLHTGAGLTGFLRDIVARHASRASLDVHVSGEAFLTRPGQHTDVLMSAIVRATGVTPRLDTGGGTSDARFIARYCPVAEFGLVGATMHKADEHVTLADLRLLATAYDEILSEFLV